MGSLGAITSLYSSVAADRVGALEKSVRAEAGHQLGRLFVFGMPLARSARVDQLLRVARRAGAQVGEALFELGFEHAQALGLRARLFELGLEQLLDLGHRVRRRAARRPAPRDLADLRQRE